MTHFRGNLASDFLIPKEVDLQVYWVELQRQTFDPNKNRMVKEKRISCFRPGDWQKMQEQLTGKGVPGGTPLNWVHVSGWHTFELLHDPSLPSNVAEQLKIK